MSAIQRLMRETTEPPSVESLGFWLSMILEMEEEEDDDREPLHLLYLIQTAAAADPRTREGLDELADLQLRMGGESSLSQVGLAAGILHRALDGGGALAPEDEIKVEEWSHVSPKVIELARLRIQDGEGDKAALEAVIRQTQETAARGEQQRRQKEEKSAVRGNPEERIRRSARLYDVLFSVLSPDPEPLVETMLSFVADLLAFLRHADAAVEVEEADDARRQLQRAMQVTQVVRAGIEMHWSRYGLRGAVPDWVE